jgi:hypothetical protein
MGTADEHTVLIKGTEPSLIQGTHYLGTFTSFLCLFALTYIISRFSQNFILLCRIQPAETKPEKGPLSIGVMKEI